MLYCACSAIYHDFPNIITYKGWKAEVLTMRLVLQHLVFRPCAVNFIALSAVMLAVLTGAGGGIVRDILAGRKPSVLRSEVYAGWAIVAALAIFFKIVHNDPAIICSF